MTSSKPGYYSILDPFVQRSQYISIKFPLHEQSKIIGYATNGDVLLLETLRYVISCIDIYFVTKFANPGHSGVIDKGKCVDEELRKAHTSFCLLDLRVHSLKGIFSPPSPLLT